MNSSKPVKFVPLTKLTRAPASDLKRIGWRGMMNAMRREGTLLVTNHDQPEAVIIAADEYAALMQVLEKSEVQDESLLAALRDSFDERLSTLNRRSSASQLRSAIRGRAKLNGKVKAGSRY